MKASNYNALKIVRTICKEKNDFEEIAKHCGEISNTIMKGKEDKKKINECVYDFFLKSFNYQGVSDKIARSYMEKHPLPTYSEIETWLKDGYGCPKLKDFDSYIECGFNKKHNSCHNNELYSSCPVPEPEMRKGTLNQTAFSLFFFLRDICKRDIVGYFDECLNKNPDNPNDVNEMRDKAISEIDKILGVGKKLAHMVLSDFLIAVGKDKDFPKTSWYATGRSMIVIDTLVHNFLHRTGILKQYNAIHSYGDASCYGENGCFKVLEQISKDIDCQVINGHLPRYYPRFIQYSIWHHCAEGKGNICNGRNINDKDRCIKKNKTECCVAKICEKLPLKK